MTTVLDASVLVKLVALESGSEQAFAIIERGDECLAPDWALAEVANALTGKVLYEQLPLAAAQAGLDRLPQFVQPFIPTRPLLPPALALAAQLKHAVYDCLYLALAESRDAILITADKKFVSVAKAGGFQRVQQLA